MAEDRRQPLRPLHVVWPPQQRTTPSTGIRTALVRCLTTAPKQQTRFSSLRSPGVPVVEFVNSPGMACRTQSGWVISIVVGAAGPPAPPPAGPLCALASCGLGGGGGVEGSAAPPEDSEERGGGGLGRGPSATEEEDAPPRASLVTADTRDGTAAAPCSKHERREVVSQSVDPNDPSGLQPLFFETADFRANVPRR